MSLLFIVTRGKQEVAADEGNDYLCDIPHIEAEAIGNDTSNLLRDGIPERYITEKLPALRDQRPYGACWSFSLAALAEINISKQENKSLDLSEMHLANFTYDSTQPPLGGFEGDVNVCTSSMGKLHVGGNYELGITSLASWKGYADESVLPYNYINGDAVDNDSVDSSKAYDDIAHIRNYYYVDIKSDIENTKRLIQKYGAVAVEYYNNEGVFYNSSYNSYYCDAEYKANHAVTIVGWDDNFSANKFKNNPGADGAWLVRNSWGEHDGGWNYSGYFWMSYYDNGLEHTAVAVDCVSNSNSEFYDNNYQYDGSIYTALCRTPAAANVFVAQKGYEQLKAVSFVTATVNEDYVVKIYKAGNNEQGPESGTLVDIIHGSTDFKGMYTVKLHNTVYLAKGERYSVVIYLTPKSGETASVACETSGSFSGLHFTALLYPDRSYIYSSGAWVDATEISGIGNVRIKAYTDNLSGLSRINGDWNYYRNGTIDSTLTTLLKYNGNWFYVRNGTIDWGYTGLVKYNGNWFYVHSGKVDFTANTLCKYNGTWWYVKRGVVDFSATTLCKYNGYWFYIRGGAVRFNERTLVKYNGYWFYVKNGIVHFDERTLVKYNGYWFYVKNGIVHFDEKTLVKYNGYWYYVSAGIIQWNYNGNCWYNGNKFRIKNGIVRF